jgi:hypothetical protein
VVPAAATISGDGVSPAASAAATGDPDPAVAVEHDVRRLEIAMDDAAIVRGGEPGADLARQFDRPILREATDATQQQREIFAIDVFHRQEGVPLVLADVEHAADVRMRDQARHPNFGVDLHQPRRVAIDRLRQKLQGDGLAQFQIVRAVDLAHAPFSQASDDAVAAVEESAGREAAVIDRVGAGQSAAGRDRFGRDVSRLVGIRGARVISHDASAEPRRRARRL